MSTYTHAFSRKHVHAVCVWQDHEVFPTHSSTTKLTHSLTNTYARLFSYLCDSWLQERTEGRSGQLYNTAGSHASNFTV